MSLQATAEDG
uniref:Uncharacterized protein n=1 Tax=Anguilla anguilla TaxID=7936 RepID=A0A0E9VVW6_ANGAN